MKKQQYFSVLAAVLFAFGAASAHAAAGGNGGGHGAGGSGGNAGGMSGGHMSGKGIANSNGFESGDRDKGLSRAADRSDMIDARSSEQPGRGQVHGHTAHAPARSHHAKRNAFGLTQ